MLPQLVSHRILFRILFLTHACFYIPLLRTCTRIRRSVHPFFLGRRIEKVPRAPAVIGDTPARVRPLMARTLRAQILPYDTWTALAR